MSDYSHIEQMYSEQLVPGMQPSPELVPPETAEQAEAYEEHAYQQPVTAEPVQGPFVDLAERVAMFNGVHFALSDEDVRAIEQVLAARVVENLQKAADEWRARYLLTKTN